MNDERSGVRTPPRTHNVSGNTRHVGVELEFAGLSSEQAAEQVAACFHGTVKPIELPFVLSVVDTKWGEFRVELDTQFVHPKRDIGDILKESPLPVSKEDIEAVRNLNSHVRQHWVGKAIAGVVPTEIVTPPIPWDELGELASLVEALRTHGAKGTDDSLVYSFGAHLNPEVASEKVEYLLAVLRAYILLSDWLRDEIRIDLMRKILPHIDPFPQDYAVKILAPDYEPDLEAFIKDYYAMNPTRNRELDMLPLFKHLAPDILANLTDDDRIKARPTFHYRLPNMCLSDPDWSVVREWNRWVAVEALAADKENLRRLADIYLANARSSIGERLKEVGRWLENLTSP
ncbi:amidoligase family protein [uncultured Sneathiella sp.]|uniref:amidoligase family protein n=1 Tax=uncultured Sneathiella sp. TaxID=879315 RepID=UPI0030EC7A69